MAELTSMLKLVESLIVALVTVGIIEDIQSSSARSLSYSYYPNVKTKMGKYSIFFVVHSQKRAYCSQYWVRVG